MVNDSQTMPMKTIHDNQIFPIFLSHTFEGYHNSEKLKKRCGRGEGGKGGVGEVKSANKFHSSR